MPLKYSTLAPRFLCVALEPVALGAQLVLLLGLGGDDVSRSAPRLEHRVDYRCVTGGFGDAPSALGGFETLVVPLFSLGFAALLKRRRLRRGHVLGWSL